MLKNYFKVALRNLTRYKVYSFINIFGLAVGMAVCILIFLYVKYELSYDKFHEKSDRIYRVSREWFDNEGKTNLHLGHVAPAAAPLLENDFPGIIEHAVRVLNPGNSLMEYEGKKLYEQVHFADKGFFDVFSFKMLEGNPSTALKQPNSVVLSASAAKRMFGNESPVGKAMRYDDEIDLTVTGVTEDVPANSHFHYDYVVSFNIVEDFYGRESILQNWSNNSYSTYLLLAEGYSAKDLEPRLPGFLDKHMAAEFGKASEWTRLHLWPITSIHLYSNLDSEAEPNGKIEHVYIYSIIGIFILLIACINFMNLATARSARRSKEVGLRKVMGAFKATLIKQFLAESFLITLLGLLFSLLIVWASLPLLNSFIEKELSFNFSPFTILALLGIALLVGLISGSYPAFFLSSFEPAAVLKGINKPGSKQSFFRSTLVVLQFSISIILIAGMIIVYNQLQYVKSKDLGFNRENLVVLPSSENILKQYESIKDRLLKHPNVHGVTMATRVPSGRLLDSGDARIEKDGEVKPINFRLADVSVDHDFINTLEIPILAGRNFNRNFASDSLEAFILNESAVFAMGYSSPDNVIGTNLHYNDRRGKIIGVAKNFHFESLHQPINPVVLQVVDNERIAPLMVRIDNKNRAETLAWLENEWTFLRPDIPFNHYFIEDNFASQYASEEKLGQLIGYFSTIAILVACLGLLGLASFTTEQRTREIGIRKVLGASVSEIVILLLKGFSKLVALAFLLACPLVYFSMSKWLENFAYHEGLSWQPFVLAGISALLIAWATVSFLSIKASIANPVKSLKVE